VFEGASTAKRLARFGHTSIWLYHTLALGSHGFHLRDTSHV